MAPSSTRIAIVDSGSGNLRSVEKALARAGAHPLITSDPDVVRRAERVVVPGQGAFGQCVEALREAHLDEALREAIARGTPYLGICLGLQVLFSASEEGSDGGAPVPGLNIIAGQVRRFRVDSPLKVPHIGWNRVHRAASSADERLLADIPDGAYVYFVHSYHVVPEDPAVTALTAVYGEPFAAAVRVDNVFATQFHPEKSQHVGLRLLENFARTA